MDKELIIKRLELDNLIKSHEIPSVQNFLAAAILSTPLGDMLAIADLEFLYFFDFLSRKNLNSQLLSLVSYSNKPLLWNKNLIITQLETEINAYSAGTLYNFTVPIFISGTEFQKKVWNALRQIPYSQKISYLDLATQVGNTKACRAVANANSKNKIAIIIPCHRVIQHNGALGGYAGGIEIKKKLLQLEMSNV